MTDRQTLRDELRGLLATWNPALTGDIDDTTSLIASSALDSLALFNLVLWIEAKSGRTIDPTSVDFAQEWDSIAAILNYLDQSTPRDQTSSTGVAAAPVPSIVSRYRIEEYEPRHKLQVAAFQTGLWSPDAELTLRYLEWKYERNPCAGTGRIYLAFDDRELVGMRGFYPSEWEIGQPARRTSVLVADDLLVAETHRNTGVVRELMRAAGAQLRNLGERYVFNLSGSPLTVLESMAMGWRSAGMLQPVVRARADTISSRVRRRLEHSLGVAPNSPFATIDAAGAVDDDARGLTVQIDNHPRAAEIADLVSRIGRDGRLRHVRDEPYLTWRYGNPLHEYRFLYAIDRNNTLCGYLAIRRSVDRIPHSQQVRIVDLEAIDEEVVALLLRTLVAAGEFENILTWALTVNERTRAELGRLGFRPVEAKPTAPGTPYVLVWSLDDAEIEPWRLDGCDLLSLASWDMRMIYTMAG